MTAVTTLAGRWRIIETAAWPREHLDLCGPVSLRIDPDGTGEMAFGALIAAVNAGLTAGGIEFDWNGSDEGDQVQDNGWADLCEHGSLEGEIAYDNGDDTTFIAVPWPFSAAC